LVQQTILRFEMKTFDFRAEFLQNFRSKSAHTRTPGPMPDDEKSKEGLRLAFDLRSVSRKVTFTVYLRKFRNEKLFSIV